MFSFIKKLFSSSRTSCKDTLYVSNLVYTATNYDLNQAFASYGEITNTRIIKDPRTRKSKGYGFVTFAKHNAATHALEMHGYDIQGRPIRVRLAHSKSNN